MSRQTVYNFFYRSRGLRTPLPPYLKHGKTRQSKTISLGLILLICLKLMWRKQSSMFNFILVFFLFGTLLILTENRTGLFMTLVVLCLIMVHHVKKFSFYLIFFALALIIIILFVVLFVEGSEEALVEKVSLLITRNQDLDDLSGRAELWPLLWDEFKKSPWLGHGYFVTSEAGALYVWYEWTNCTAHNLLLQLLVTTGIVGFLLFAAGILFPVVMVFLRLKKHSPFFSFLVYIFVWYGGWSIFNASFLGPIKPESVVFFAVMGLVFGELSNRKKDEF